MCEHNWLHIPGMQVCENCGLQRQLLEMDKFSVHSSPLGRCYDRVGRFQQKIDCLLGRGSIPKSEDPVWKYLEGKTMTGPSDIRLALSKSKLKNKHYDHVRSFTDIFTKFRCDKYNQLETRGILMRKFSRVNRCFRGTSFFSYGWLTRLFLEEMKSPLLVYLKKPTSKRRAKKYVHMLQVVQCSSTW